MNVAFKAGSNFRYLKHIYMGEIIIQCFRKVICHKIIVISINEHCAQNSRNRLRFLFVWPSSKRAAISIARGGGNETVHQIMMVHLYAGGGESKKFTSWMWTSSSSFHFYAAVVNSRANSLRVASSPGEKYPAFNRDLVGCSYQVTISSMLWKPST